MKSFYAILFICVSFIITQDASSQTASEIVNRAEEKMRGESMRGTMSMKIVRPNWTREMEFKTWARGEEYSLILITAPARDNGTAFLKRGNEIWNWQPTIERSIKMPPSMMSQSWMGSDFSNDDLVRQSSLSIDYTHKLIGNEELEGYDCYKIELTPKKNAAVVWGKVIMWISKDDLLELKTEFYDESGELINTMIGSEVTKLDGRLIPSKLTVLPADEKNQSTIVKYENIEFGVDIPKDFFTVQNMKRL